MGLVQQLLRGLWSRALPRRTQISRVSLVYSPELLCLPAPMATPWRERVGVLCAGSVPGRDSRQPPTPQEGSLDWAGLGCRVLGLLGDVLCWPGDRAAPAGAGHGLGVLQPSCPKPQHPGRASFPRPPRSSSLSSCCPASLVPPFLSQGLGPCTPWDTWALAAQPRPWELCPSAHPAVSSPNLLCCSMVPSDRDVLLFHISQMPHSGTSITAKLPTSPLLLLLSLHPPPCVNGGTIRSSQSMGKAGQGGIVNWQDEMGQRTSERPPRTLQPLRKQRRVPGQCPPVSAPLSRLPRCSDEGSRCRWRSRSAGGQRGPAALALPEDRALRFPQREEPRAWRVPSPTRGASVQPRHRRGRSPARRGRGRPQIPALPRPRCHPGPVPTHCPAAPSSAFPPRRRYRRCEGRSGWRRRAAASARRPLGARSSAGAAGRSRWHCPAPAPVPPARPVPRPGRRRWRRGPRASWLRAAGDRRATGHGPWPRRRPATGPDGASGRDGRPGRGGGGEWAGRGPGRCLPFINRRPDGCPGSLPAVTRPPPRARYIPVSAVSRDGWARDERRGHRVRGEAEGAGLLWLRTCGGWCPSVARPETRRARAGEAQVSRAPPFSPGSATSRSLRRVRGSALVPAHPVGAAAAARGRRARPRCTMGAVVLRGGTRAPGVPRGGAAHARGRAARVARGCRC